MNDPLSPLTVPPPRYLLESDSSDEEGQGSYLTSPSRRTQNIETPRVTHNWTSPSADIFDAVILGTGQPGRYLTRRYGLDSRPSDLEVSLSGLPIGRGWKVEKDLVVALQDELDQPSSSVWECAKSLMGMQAKKWIVASSYLPSMYIPGPSETIDPSTVPIRYVHITGPSPAVESTGIKLLDPPNFVTGLAASLATMASHPSSTLPTTSTLTMVLLPLPLSSIPDRHLSFCISALSSTLGSSLTSRVKSSASRWSEDDDEPFSGPGMGGKRKSWTGKQALREDVAGMYM